MKNEAKIHTNWLVPFGWVFFFFRYCWRDLKKIIFATSSGYERSARLWLYSMLGFVVITTYIAFYIKQELDSLIVSGKNTNSILAIALVKLLLILAPLYGVRFSVRNYSSSKHLAAVNRHKSVVMKTLLAFLDRKEIQPAQRGKVMEIAAQETFSTPQTGFINSHDLGPGIEQNIFEKITRSNSP